MGKAESLPSSLPGNCRLKRAQRPEITFRIPQVKLRAAIRKRRRAGHVQFAACAAAFQAGAWKTTLNRSHATSMLSVKTFPARAHSREK